MFQDRRGGDVSVVEERLWLAKRASRTERHLELLRTLAAHVALDSPFHLRLQDTIDGLELQVARAAVVSERLLRA